MTFAEQALGCLVAPTVPVLGGYIVTAARPAYGAPMDDRLEVVLADKKYPEKITYCCVLKWPEQFVMKSKPAKVLRFKLKPSPTLRFKLKGNA